VACGEVETTHPGYLRSQDTFYVVHSSAWAGSINKRLLIPTARWPLPSSIPPRPRSPQRISSMTGCCRCLRAGPADAADPDGSGHGILWQGRAA
jgi:hypothetical protein